MFKTLLSALFLFGATLGAAPSVAPADRLSPAQLKALVKKKGVQFIDIRTPEEYAEGHIKGAKLLPLDQLSERFGELDKKRPVVLVCRSGNRTTAAWSFLKGKGFSKVRHLEGGLNRWTAEGGALER